MMGWGWWGPGALFMVLCMVMMIWMMSSHGAHAAHSAGSHGSASGGAKRILGERLARGEIDTDEYERRVAALQASGEIDSEDDIHHGP